MLKYQVLNTKLLFFYLPFWMIEDKETEETQPKAILRGGSSQTEEQMKTQIPPAQESSSWPWPAWR